MIYIDFLKKLFKNMGPLLRKAWYFVWEDDHWTSWIVNVILAIILIKFIVYPGLGLALGTNFPIVAVVSSSMEHNEGNFDGWWDSKANCGGAECTQREWYQQYGIAKPDFENYPFKNGFNKGDLMVLYGKEPKSLKNGDILVFNSARADPIIHRIVEINEVGGKYFFHTKGDNNIMSIQSSSLDETFIDENNVIGFKEYGKGSKAILRIPYLGYVKIFWVYLFN